MKYLVTGASGFAGRHLISRLTSDGHDTYGLVRRPGSLHGTKATEVVADLEDDGAVRAGITNGSPEGIFHLGAPQTSVGRSYADPEGTITKNLGTFKAVLDAAVTLSSPPRILFASSAEVPGKVTADLLPMKENLPPNPTSPYAKSKLLCEQACSDYVDKLPIVIVRPFNHIGPGQRDTFVIPSFAKQIAEIEAGLRKPVLEHGNLGAKRDFTDVRDMVAAYAILMQRGEPGEIYHAGTGVSRSIGDVLDFMISQSTATIEKVSDPDRQRPDDIPEQRSDSQKLAALGWKPEIPFEQTIKDVLDEARDNLKKH